jgi:CubicO group peptidase (beta-lactamase class C family)
LGAQLVGLKSRLTQLMSQFDVPGAVVGVLHHDEIHVVGSGITSLDTKLPVTPDTVFQIGSNT